MSLNLPNKALRSRATDGFTLLEMLIAMVILVFISIGISRTMVQTFRLRDIISTEGDFHNSIRMAMDVVQRDVSMIYSPQLMAPPKKKTEDPNSPAKYAPAPGAQEMGDLSEGSKFWLAALDSTGIRASRFTGSTTQMSFVSLSHHRIYKNAPESEFAKIIYSLDRDDLRPDPEQETMVLSKTEATRAFTLEEEKEDANVLPLLHGIKKFTLHYYYKEKDQWLNAWDNEKEDFRGLYPDIVKIEIEVVGPMKLNHEGTYFFRPEIPLRGLDPST
jgi:general secretion pathway protein J